MKASFHVSSVHQRWVSFSSLACVVLLLIAASLGFAATPCAGSPRQGGAGQAQGHPPQFRVVRSLCGSKSTGHGADFQVQDPKSVFHVPEDHQIIVYFEWEGPPGSHQAEGSWRGPDGKVVVTSDFDIASPGTHYTGYWTLAIPESIAQGLWALEATIDGQPAGTQTFQIVSTRNAALTSPGAPPMPTPAEVYQRAAAASVFVTSLDGDGEAITRGFGFFIDKNIVLTAFQVVDGASSLRVDFADGSHAIVNDLVAWNRPRDWAILKVNSSSVQPLEKAAPNSWKVGDLCYVLTSQGQGSRTIQSVNLTGLQGSPQSAQRLTISAYGGQNALGAPLLDSYGRAIGVLGGGLAGMGSARMGNWTSYFDPGPGSTMLADPTVLPLAQLPEAATSQQAVLLSDLATRGALIMPLPRTSQVANGTLCSNFKKVGGDAIFPVSPGRNFSHKQGGFALVVTWAPIKKLKGMQQLRVYDANNQPVAQTAPAKIDLQPRVTLYSAWKVALSSVPPGIYRIDVIVDGEPQWREFFQMVD